MAIENATFRELLALLADSAVTSIRATGRGVEVRRGGRTHQVALAQSQSALPEAIESLIGPGRASGSVSLRGFVGFAALPPVAADPILVLHRPLTARISPEAVTAAGLLTPEIARAAAALAASGAGVLVAGPRGARTTLVLSALVQLLPPTLPLVLVEDEPQIALTRDAVRLRELPADLLRSLGDVLLVLDLMRPPSLLGLTPPLLAAIRARSPEAACARACSGYSVPVLGRLDQAVLLADLMPLLLWYDPTPRLIAVYELLPTPAIDAPCRLQMLVGTDPITGTLVSTGAVPRDPQLAAVWAGVIS